MMKVLRMGWFGALLALVLLAPAAGHALENGLARTPPMGWNSWNKYACKGINEAVVRETADAMASNGMKDAGYQYVIVDDCWASGRDAEGNIVVDKDKFPSGIKALADYIHGKGLKFGIYTDAGTMTCAKRPGSIGHEYQDARQYAAWGVDYLKEDWCNTLPGQNSEASYTLMRDALKASGRPILFSICEWGSTKPWLWAGSIGNMWRSTPDIQDCWDCKRDWGGSGVTQILDMMNGLESYAGPGHWNDPDMLEIGNGKMTEDEYRTHMSLWVILAAPLLAGNDLSKMTEADKNLLMNKDAIAIDQDALGKQGDRLYESGDLDVWTKPLSGGRVAVGLFNRSWSTRDVSVDLAEIGFKGGGSVRDVWKEKDLGHRSGVFTERLPKHGAALIIVGR